jgi:hypothetical protein
MIKNRILRIAKYNLFIRIKECYTILFLLYYGLYSYF